MNVRRKRSRSAGMSAVALSLLIALSASAASPEAGTAAKEGQTGKMLVTDLDGQVREITYVVERGRAIYQDDIDLGPVEAAGATVRSFATGNLARRWADNTVYYEYDVLPAGCKDSKCACACPAADPCTPLLGSETTAGSDQHRVRTALDTYEELTGLRFKKGRVKDKPYFSFAFQSGSGFTHSDACNQNFGFPVQVTFSSFSERTVLHEVGHVLGLMHEQMRTDRDQYIELYPLCMTNGGTSFAKGSATFDEALAPYDIDSVMQYESFSQSRAQCSEPAPGDTLPIVDCCPTLMKKLAFTPQLSFRYTVPSGGLSASFEGTSYSAAAGDVLSFKGQYVRKSPGLSKEDINSLYQMYPPKLDRNENEDRFGSAAAVGDFDGDGYDDLAIGAPNEGFEGGPRSGAVFLYKGTFTGLAPWRVIEEHAELDGEEGDEFGAALAAGDLDGDHKDDLVVGAPRRRLPGGARAGAVYLFLGSELGLKRQDRLHQENIGGSGTNKPGDRFGAALAFGRFGEGRQIAIGAPGEGPGGRVYVLRYEKGTHAHDDGGTGTLVFRQRFGAERTAGDEFGAALAAGDLDADDDDELVVGSPESMRLGHSGTLYVMAGGAGGLSKPGSITQPAGEPGLELQRFGAAVAVGRLQDTQGRRQIAAAAPGAGSGRVYVYDVRDPGPDLAIRSRQALSQPGALITASDRFGESLAIGDFDGDRIDDLAVGIPYADTSKSDVGSLWLYRGRAGSSPALEPWSPFFQPAGHGPDMAHDYFGHALAAGDFNNSGRADLAIGVPGKSPNGAVETFFSGAVWVLKGRQGDKPAFAADEHQFTTYLDQNQRPQK